MPLSPALARWLVQRGHDAVHASEEGMAQAPDEEILAKARREARVVVTADLDFPRLLAQSGAKGPGLILFRGGNFSQNQAEELLKKCLAAVPEEELVNSIVVLEESRIRKHRLPV